MQWRAPFLIENGQVTWHDVASGRSETVRIERLVGQADSVTDEVALSGAGAFEGKPVTLAGELGSIATLRQGDEPYPIALKLALGSLEIALRGQLTPEREAQLDVRLAGPSLATLGDPLDRPLPELGAYQLQGKLAGPIKDLALDDFGGTIGSAGIAQIRIADVRIEHLMAGEGVRVQVAASGAQLARLAQALGVEMAPFGPCGRLKSGGRLDLQLRPVPEKQKLSTLAIPVDIEGSLQHPEIKPRKGAAAAQAVRGVLGGLLIPLNQISALFGKETVDACADALRQAKERRQEQATMTQPPT